MQHYEIVPPPERDYYTACGREGFARKDWCPNCLDAAARKSAKEETT